MTTYQQYGNLAIRDDGTADNNGNSTGTIWTMWTSSSTSATSSNEYTWIQWNGTPISGTININSPATPELTPEQIEALRQDAERQRAEAEIRQQQEQAAEATALELLESELTPEQRADFMKDNAFFVVSKSGKLYQIKKGRSQNIYELDANRKPIRRFCIVPKTPIPTPDILLTQKIMIEHFEDEFLRVANSWPL